jgi:hypothetical protein
MKSLFNLRKSGTYYQTTTWPYTACMVHQRKPSCVQRKFVPFVPRIVDRNSVLLIDTGIDFRSRCEISPVKLGRGRYKVQCSIYHVRECHVVGGAGG